MQYYDSVEIEIFEIYIHLCVRICMCVCGGMYMGIYMRV